MNTITCQHCHNLFIAKRADAKTCSPACRVSFNRSRQGEDKLDKRRAQDRERQRYRYARSRLDKKTLRLIERRLAHGFEVSKYDLAAVELFKRRFNLV